MGKSWSGDAQQELPAEPEGPALDEHNNQQALAYMIIEHNVIACNVLSGDGPELGSVPVHRPDKPSACY
jgi:hypothetical protein